MTTKERLEKALEQDRELLDFIRQHPDSLEATCYRTGRKSAFIEVSEALTKREDK